MKKSILILATAFTLSAFFTSCRETTTRTDDVEVTDDLDDAGDELERTVDDVESTIEEGANEVENEIEGNDDL